MSVTAGYRYAGSMAAVAAALIACLSALLAFGCGGSGPGGASNSEKVAFLSVGGAVPRVILADAAGGAESRSLVDLPSDAEWATFSNDGRFMAVALTAAAGQSRTMLAATDGTAAWFLSGSLVADPAFSPDSSKLAYLQASSTGGGSELIVMDTHTGASRVAASGAGFAQFQWAGDSLILLQESGGRIFSADLAGAAAAPPRPLTPEGRHFSLEPLPVSAATDKVALIEAPPYSNIWSLDPREGALYQVTNNNRYQVTPAYLPGSSTILFMEYFPGDHGSPEDLCLLDDDGSAFTMLTQDYFYDALGSFSPQTGSIVYEHMEEAAVPRLQKPQRSIRVINREREVTQIAAASGEERLTKPVFADVPDWSGGGDLAMTQNIQQYRGQTVLTIDVVNNGDSSADVTLRILPADGVKPSAPSERPDRDTTGNPAGSPPFAPEVRGMEWNLRLGAGQTQRITVQLSRSLPGNIPGVAPPQSSVALSLTTGQAPPSMIWVKPPF